MRRFKGRSTVVLRPRTAKEVSAVLKYCNEKRIAVVPQGGNTGLVGGSVPVHDEIVLSLQSMNQIRTFDPVSGILTCDAGCVLEVLDNWLAEKGYMMPLGGSRESLPIAEILQNHSKAENDYRFGGKGQLPNRW